MQLLNPFAWFFNVNENFELEWAARWTNGNVKNYMRKSLVEREFSDIFSFSDTRMVKSGELVGKYDQQHVKKQEGGSFKRTMVDTVGFLERDQCRGFLFQKILHPEDTPCGRWISRDSRRTGWGLRIYRIRMEIFEKSSMVVLSPLCLMKYRPLAYERV